MFIISSGTDTAVPKSSKSVGVQIQVTRVFSLLFSGD